MSAPLSPAASTFTRTSPAPGCGSGCSSTLTCLSRIVTARMAVEPYTPMLSLRPAAPDDRLAILNALALRDAHDTGDPGFSRENLIDRWRAGTFDPARDSVVAAADGVLAGYGAVLHVGTFAFVVPAFEGQGIGTQLLRFTEQRTRELGHKRYRQRTVRGNTAAEALL